MTTAWFAIPGELASPTGGYRYDQEILDAFKTGAGDGLALRHLQLPGGFPFPTTEQLAETRSLLAALPGGATVLIDGLALGAFPEDLVEGLDIDLVALVHHPLALETGLSDHQSAALRTSEKTVLRHARHVVVTSPVTLETLVADYGVPAERITVALPGLVLPPPVDRSSRLPDDPVRLLSVGSLTPRKGHDLLIAALSRLSDLDWEARIVGMTPNGSDYGDELMRLSDEAGLGERLNFLGALDESHLVAQYAWADLFVLLTRYEGYGMVFAEAMAHGLPVVAGAGGAVADTVPPDAGALIPVGDIEAAAAALRTFILQSTVRRQAAKCAREHAETLPSWRDSARRIADCLRRGPQ